MICFLLRNKNILFSEIKKIVLLQIKLINIVFSYNSSDFIIKFDKTLCKIYS